VGDPETPVDAAAAEIAKYVAEQKGRRDSAKAEPKVVPINEKTKAFLAQAKKTRADYSKEKAKEKAKSEENFKNKPAIWLTVKTSPKFMSNVERTLSYLSGSDAGIYQRGNILVRLIQEWAKGVKGERVKVWKLAAVTDKALEIQMMKHIDWGRHIKIREDGVEKTVGIATNPINTGIAKYALEMRGDWPFSMVEGVINSPTLRPDGTPLDKVGYDSKTGLILINSPEVKVNPRPSRQEAEDAIELLRDLYVETKFKNEGARGVALSLDLSTVLCGAIPNTPIHIIKAPVGASGKTYVVQIAHVLATGDKCVPMGRTRNPEEFEKRLSTLFMEGRQLIFLDNHNGILQHDLLCQATTGDKVLIRKFGVLENIEVPTRAVIAATGNGISISSDLDRRTLLAEIDTGLAKPQFKKYRKPSPLDLILADRAKYIKAVLTIPLAYIAAGCPEVSNKQVLDFEDWDRLVRFPLIWLGETDPS
jgi:putative DNA primase/helicase